MRPLQYPWSALAALTVGIVLTPATTPFLGEAVDRLFPVIEDWRPTLIQREGSDLLVTGTMVKNRPCRYIPPPRAKTPAGTHLPVVSLAPTAGLSWQPSETGVRFGAWRVIGGANETVTFYLQYSCTSLWDTYVELGVVDGAKASVK